MKNLVSIRESKFTFRSDSFEEIINILEWIDTNISKSISKYSIFYYGDKLTIELYINNIEDAAKLRIMQESFY